MSVAPPRCGQSALIAVSRLIESRLGWYIFTRFTGGLFAEYPDRNSKTSLRELIPNRTLHRLSAAPADWLNVEVVLPSATAKNFDRYHDHYGPFLPTSHRIAASSPKAAERLW